MMLCKLRIETEGACFHAGEYLEIVDEDLGTRTPISERSRRRGAEKAGSVLVMCNVKKARLGKDCDERALGKRSRYSRVDAHGVRSKRMGG